jgi:hypothetical protein
MAAIRGTVSAPTAAVSRETSASRVEHVDVAVASSTATVTALDRCIVPNCRKEFMEVSVPVSVAHPSRSVTIERSGWRAQLTGYEERRCRDDQ